MRARVFLLLLVALPALATDIVFKRGTGGGGGAGGVGAGSCTAYVEPTSPIAGSTPGNTCDTWVNTTDHTFFANEDGLTEAWTGQPTAWCAAFTSDGATIVTGQDAYLVKVPWDATVTVVSGITIGGTSAAFSVSEYTTAGVLSNETEASQTATTATGEVSTTSIDDPVLDRGDWLRVDIGAVTGNVTNLTVCVTAKPR